MRCGAAWANTVGEKPAAVPIVNAAAPPASNSRRLTAVAASGAMQQLQRADSRCLVDCSICHYLSRLSAANCPQHAHVTRTVASRTQWPQLPDVSVCHCARSNAYLGGSVISM